VRDYVAREQQARPQAKTLVSGPWRAAAAPPAGALQPEEAPPGEPALGPAALLPQPPYSENLEAFRAQIARCQRCPLGKLRKRLVFGEGRPGVDLMLVGEAPSAEDDASGRPFTGPAGRELDKLLAAMGLKRDQVFITHAVKCRPVKTQLPKAAEVEACRDYLEHQISLLKPKIICTLGSAAASALLQREMTPSERGKFTQFEGIPLFPTFNPGAGLSDTRVRDLMYKDMKTLVDRLKVLA
jgi:DNA polymerase